MTLDLPDDSDEDETEFTVTDDGKLQKNEDADEQEFEELNFDE